MSLWERLTGKVVDVAALGQKKRAVATGIMAFDGPLGDLRLEIAIKSHPWLQNTATSGFLLSAWAAQALQDMAAILETAAQQHLGEQGKLPEATFVLADRLYGDALEWIEHAQRALAAIDVNPEYKLFRSLPAAAPRMDWVAVAPPTHFVAAIRSAVQLGTSTEDALNTAQNDRSRLQRRYDGAFETIESAVRMARAKLDQVEAAESDRQAVRLSRDIWTMLAEVVRIYFLAGQQAAMPALIDPRYDAAASASARAARLPPPPATRQSTRGQAGQGAAGAPRPGGYAPRTTGQPSAPPPPPPPPPPAEPTLGERLGLRFDAWALTEHGAKATYQNDRARIAELEAFWRADTNPAETYRLFGLVTSAVKAGKVAARPGEFSRSCPWISTFVALADVSIGTERFATGQLFTLKVGQEGDYFGRSFDRQGFLPGTQKSKPRSTPSPEPDTRAKGQPGATASSPRIETQHHAQRAQQQTRRDSARTPHPPPEPVPADIWLLTAAFERPQRRANPADADKVRRLWDADPDPARTVRFHDEVMAAVRAGDVRQHGDEALRDCPWSQVYVAVKQVAIGGVRLERNEKFALDVGMAGGTFRRRIARLGLITTRV
jgi:hypothetical protein